MRTVPFRADNVLGVGDPQAIIDSVEKCRRVSAIDPEAAMGCSREAAAQVVANGLRNGYEWNEC